MPDSTPGVDEARRREIVDATSATYSEYVESGRSKRWTEGSPGMAIAIQDRDRWIVDALRLSSPGLVIDLGSGDGALGSVLETADARPIRLLGVDIQEQRVTEARVRVPWAEFVVASADEIPADDGSARAVVAMTFFSSVTDPWFRSRVATEVDRVLAPGGRLVVYDMRYPSPSNPNVNPISVRVFRDLFVGWHVQSRTLTLLPPVARTALAGGARRYRSLHALPVLRSHIGMILTKPD
jgi:ubiquinone/menaquinone biosynthesis C-methylase UbiE